MKKTKFLTVILLICIITTIAVSAVHVSVLGAYDYSSFEGVWHKVDPDMLNGDVVLEIKDVIENEKIVFSIDGKVTEGVIKDNQVKWNEMWWDGDMGLTLTFFDDHIHLAYSRYSEEWYSEIVFVSDTAKPQKMQLPTCNVLINGETVNFDQPPVIIDGRTLVPVRAIIEAVGGEVWWDSVTKTATLKLGDNTIKLIIDSNIAYLNEEEHILDVAPRIINNRTLLPIRFVAESFGFSVDWDSNTRTVIILADTKTNPKNVTETFDEKLADEFNMFVCSEAGAAEITSYNILKGYDCNNISDVRALAFRIVTDYSNYLRNLRGYEEYNLKFCGVDSATGLYWKNKSATDNLIREYYNISGDIPEFDKNHQNPADTMFTKENKYFYEINGVGISDYKAFIEKVYDLGNNKYYFIYKLGSGMPGSFEIDYVFEETYYAVMERKNISNGYLSDMEFWSVEKTGTEPLITVN